MSGLYFSDFFGVQPKTLADYGAFDISVVSDLPLFIDPFLLFNSDKPEYQCLHEGIIRYLRFLKDEASPELDPGLVKAWFRFKEVKQNWLGFAAFGNGGSALGDGFAASLRASLSSILDNFGEESITRGSHLEKLCLIKPGVGRDRISDFTTNLIKDYLLDYTQAFAHQYLSKDLCQTFAVTRARFNYQTKSWETRNYYLPLLRNDFVLLTPIDMLTRDETWINHAGMIRSFDRLPDALDDDQLRGQVNQYFASRLSKDPSPKERSAAAEATIFEFRELIDIYIRLQEDDGYRAEALSSEKTRQAHELFVEIVRLITAGLADKTDFYQRDWTSYDEARERVLAFKDYIENQDGYLLLNRAGKQGPSNEKDVQLFFGLIWHKTEFDVNREANNGRGPVDFKVSRGWSDKTLVEFKLAKSSSLKRNLENQVSIYEKANGTRSSLKVVICYSADDQTKLDRVMSELDMVGEQSIISIDARNDNKPSASKA